MKPRKRSGMSRSHRLILRVTFDKPCTPAEAARAAADCIHGGFYLSFDRKSGPESFDVRSIKKAPKQ